MKQLLILSGKGGTGKTTVSASFIKLANARAFADCDVDAPNLHLVMPVSKATEQKDFCGLGMAKIESNRCINCGKCKEMCRFDAIESDESGYHVKEYGCESCGVCIAVCPVNAVEMIPNVAGDLLLYKDEVTFSTAKLKMGSGTSGKLVAEVKKQLRDVEDDVALAIIDGSPGIGCPVIASISGVDMVLVVAEPSISGISDMTRIVDTALKFGTKVGICVNKYDTNHNKTNEIVAYCNKYSIPFLGKIPYDREIVKALNEGMSAFETKGEGKKAIVEVFDHTMEVVKNI